MTKNACLNPPARRASRDGSAFYKRAAMICLSAALVALPACNDDDSETKNSPAAAPRAAADLNEARRQTEEAETILRQKSQDLQQAEAAKEAARQSAEARPADKDAQAAKDQALTIFRRVEAEYEKQRQETERLRARQKNLEEQTARQESEAPSPPPTQTAAAGDLNCQPGTPRAGPAPRGGYYPFTKNKAAALTFHFPDKYGNKISQNEALILMGPECLKPPYADAASKCFLGPLCEESSNWLGFRKGLKCVCRFYPIDAEHLMTDGANAHRQEKRSLYLMPRPGEHSNRYIKTWPDRLKRLSAGGAP